MNGPRSIEDYLMDLINQKYAQRVFSILRTEHEKQYLDKGKEPDHGEYEWMVKRALEIHKAMNIPGGNDAVEEAKD